MPRISELSTTLFPTLEHELATEKSGESVKLTVGQIRGILKYLSSEIQHLADVTVADALDSLALNKADVSEVASALAAKADAAVTEAALDGKVDSSNVSSFIAGLFSDQNASEAQTRLGISTFIKALLDDTNGPAAWVSLGGTSAIGPQGAVRLPNGLMLVWGANDSALNEISLTFHTSFPAACVFFCPVIFGPVPDLDTMVSASYTDVNATGAYVQKRYTAGDGAASVVGGGTLPIRWFAIGY